ncbi:uncharacterized protein LOC135822565 [Sycon ciliatum]|uniref:uncharacterized protein LOC135822565 n=1 Tax=Sycon ciliatum TaxID=27933 RepID=UPI0020A841DA|eukprot:scpid39186/ scgid2969/ 
MASLVQVTCLVAATLACLAAAQVVHSVPTLDATISTPDGPVSVTLGSQTFLACSFRSSNGTFTITITHAGSPVEYPVIISTNASGPSQQQQTAIMLVAMVSPDTAGQFVCTARNYAGSSSAAWNVLVVPSGMASAGTTVMTASAMPLSTGNITNGTSTSTQPGDETPGLGSSFQLENSAVVITGLGVFDGVLLLMVIYLLCCGRRPVYTQSDDSKLQSVGKEVESPLVSECSPANLASPSHAARLRDDEKPSATKSSGAPKALAVRRSVSMPLTRGTVGQVFDTAAPNHQPSPSGLRKISQKLSKASNFYEQLQESDDAQLEQTEGRQQPRSREVYVNVMAGSDSAISDSAGGLGATLQATDSLQTGVVKSNPLYQYRDEVEVGDDQLGQGYVSTSSHRKISERVPDSSVSNITNAGYGAQATSISTIQVTPFRTNASSQVSLSPAGNDVFFTAAKLGTYPSTPSYTSFPSGGMDFSAMEMQDVDQWAQSRHMTDSGPRLPPPGQEQRQHYASLPAARSGQDEDGKGRTARNTHTER